MTASQTPQTPQAKPTYRQTHDDFWKQIVERPDGTLDLDQVKRELHDYHQLLQKIPKVYDEITGGRISKPNTGYKTGDRVITRTCQTTLATWEGRLPKVAADGTFLIEGIDEATGNPERSYFSDADSLLRAHGCTQTVGVLR
ncbi:hypothetical protein ACGFJT_37390 [Actinomadura geliboluensis]|uniref:hypothetical protein n=1 Tax=Actinomadura geliboluensis TaxID=882440 RepID=UPI00371C2FE0